MAGREYSSDFCDLKHDQTEKKLEEIEHEVDALTALRYDVARLTEAMAGLCLSFDRLREEQNWLLRFIVAQLVALVLLFVKNLV